MGKVVLLLRGRTGSLLQNHAWAHGSPPWAVAGLLARRALMGQFVAAGRTSVEMFFKNWFLSLTCKINIKWYRSPKIMKPVLLVP